MSKGNRSNLERLLRSAWIRHHLSLAQRTDDQLEVPSSRPPNSDRSQTREKIILLAMDATFLAAAFVNAMPVVARWSCWLGCWTTTALLVQAHFDAPKRLAARIAVTAFAVLLFTGCFESLFSKQLTQERAARLTGELCSFRSFWGTCYTPPTPMIEIGGDSGSKFIYVGDGPTDFGAFARNVGLKIERGKHGMEISTPVLDRSGKRIASIEKNQWTVVPPPEIWDKNYTDNALEIKDNRGDVVLQIRFLSDRLQIAAEWRDQFGRGQEWAKCSAIPNMPKTGCIIPWGDSRTELQNEISIDPIFQYPSSEHLGEFLKATR